jgi:hypothetical protein
VPRRDADVQVGEHRAAHRVDRVGQRVDPVEHVQPHGQPGDREHRARAEVHGQDDHLGQRHERLHLRHPRRGHHAERGDREGQQQLQREHLEDQHRRVRDADQPGQAEHEHALEARHRRAAQALAEDQRAAPHRRDHHLAYPGSDHAGTRITKALSQFGVRQVNADGSTSGPAATSCGAAPAS